ncbi:MAG: GTPase ObgE [Oscillospiraceae bacterium]
MFVDKANIRVKAGNGGNGAVSFHREKYVAAGGPDGGDGGKGGDIVFVADSNITSLLPFKYKTKYTAEDGKDGQTKRCSGKSAPAMLIKVPLGTLVREKTTGRIIADISDAEPVTICKGGKGGWGNIHFATPTRQIPRFSKPGLSGEELDITLELKLLADVGLVGFPNVGKSSLISVISEAKPKIANYPFTTLTPVLGVVKVDEDTNFVMADIPGLIEGAGEGVGLGHEFLRHVERCRLIVHIVDVAGLEDRDPIEDFDLINKELKTFSQELGELPMIAAANKCDVATKEQIDKFTNEMEKRGIKVFLISAATRMGTRELVNEISQQLSKLEPIKIYAPEPIPEGIKKGTHDFTIQKENGIYFIEGDWLENIVSNADTEDYESLLYLQKVLRTSGIVDKLEEMGVEEGDTVAIGGVAFDYVR